MLRTLNIVVAFYWTAFFTALAYVAMASGDDVGRLAGLSGLELTGDLPVVSRMAVAMLVTFCAVLFAWSLLSALMGTDPGGQAVPEMMRLAFGAAALTFALLLVVGLTRGAPNLPAIAAHFTALLASSIAVRNDQKRDAAAQPEEAETVGAAKARMAGRALQAARLSRLIGHRPRAGEEGR